MSGRIVPFYEVCPDYLETPGEMREITVRNHPRLPDDTYGLIDAYCFDPGCDCRVAYLFVVGERRPGKVLARITFGWEPLEFYRIWMGSGKVTNSIRKLKGPALMQMMFHSRLAPALLELVTPRLREEHYVRLLKRHYSEFKNTLRRRDNPRRG